VDPPTTATLSGFVREATTQVPIAAATVRAAGATATTAANRSFTIQNVTIGTVSLLVEAPGFDGYTQSVEVRAGGTTHDVALARRTIYTDASIAAYLPTSVSRFRGVIFLLPGSRGNSTAFVRGERVCWADPIVACPNDEDFRSRLLVLADRYGLALFGMNNEVGGPETFNKMLASLVSVAQQSGRAELASAPILLVGSSQGGCNAHGFARLHAERVIGFMSAKGSCHFGGPSPAAAVPGYLFIGEEDPVSPDARQTITQLFLANRREHALWAVAIEAGSGHEWPRDNAITTAWMNVVLAMRLAPANSQTHALMPLAETSGWLGNRTTRAISPFATYPDDPLVASWLPTEQLARDWQKLVGGS
jgi:predicted esterase